jgi:hypothetical protein
MAKKKAAKRKPMTEETRRRAAEKRADTRLKKELAAIPDADPSKYEAPGDTPEERRAAARKQKIAEIKKADKAKADKKTATRSAAGKKAAATRKRAKKGQREWDAGLVLNLLEKATSRDAKMKVLLAYREQGQRTLSRFPGKDLHQEVNAPACHTTLHDIALLSWMLLDQTQCKAAQPR